MLLLHDYVTVVEMIRLTLNHGAYATEVAATPEQAVSILEGWQPHLVILDMGLDTEQVIKRIGSKPGGGLRVPVIGLTRRGDLKGKLAAFDAGVDDVMTSPFSPEELAGARHRPSPPYVQRDGRVYADNQARRTRDRYPESSRTRGPP